jgi:hypothetical protein
MKLNILIVSRAGVIMAALAIAIMPSSGFSAPPSSSKAQEQPVNGSSKWLRSKTQEQGELNDSWFQGNKDKVKVTLARTYYSKSRDKAMDFKSGLMGSIENLSNEKIAGVVVEVIVKDSTQAESLKERIYIETPAFRGQKLQFKVIERSKSSEFMECLRKLEQPTWSFQVIAVIPQRHESSYARLMEYYKFQSKWSEE